MEIAFNAAVGPLPAEEDLLMQLERIGRLSKGRKVATIAVEDQLGNLRLSINAFSKSEASGVERVLLDRGFEGGSSVDAISEFDEFDSRDFEESRLQFSRAGFDQVFRHMGDSSSN